MSKILIIDDDASVCKFCDDLFTRDGHEVLTLLNGHQLFKLIKSEKPDLILLDLKLTEEDGLALLKSMPNHAANRIPVAIFSGFVTPQIETHAYELGAIEVIRKEAGTDDLRMKVNKILSSKDRLLNRKDNDLPGKILVVDDEPEIREVLKDFFESRGFEVALAENGQEAIQIVRDEKPSVVLLDVTMPIMSGVETLRKIRDINPDIGVVMATGQQDEEVVRETTELGAYAYVLKPFDFKYLELVVLTRLMLAS